MMPPLFSPLYLHYLLTLYHRMPHTHSMRIFHVLSIPLMLCLSINISDKPDSKALLHLVLLIKGSITEDRDESEEGLTQGSDK